MKIQAKDILMFFGLLFFLSSLAPVTGIEVFSSVTIAFELMLLLVLLWNFVLFNKKLKKFEFLFLSFLYFFSLLHFVVNPTSDKLSFIKLISIVVFFFSGKYIPGDMQFRKAYTRNIVFFSICILPFLLRITQVIIGIPQQGYSIFVNSNNFLYCIIATSLLVFLFFPKNRKASMLYILFGSLISKTIGGVLALVAAIMIVFRKKIVNTVGLATVALAAIALYLITTYSSIAVFERVKNSYIVFTELSTNNSSLASLKDVEYSQALSYTTGGQEDLSFLFRLKHWSEIKDHFFKGRPINMFFGHGFMSIPNVTTANLVAHNDYLGVLYEFGFLPFIILVFGYARILRQFRNEVVGVSLFAIAIFHFSENLYYNFLVTSIHFFCLGHFYSMKQRNENTSNK